MADSSPLPTVPPRHGAQVGGRQSAGEFQANSGVAPEQTPAGELDALSISNFRKLFELLDAWEREHSEHVDESSDVNRPRG